jgi:HEAT repeat protein
MKYPARYTALRGWALWVLAAGVSAGLGVQANMLDDLVRVQALMERGEFDRAFEIAGTLSGQSPLFRNLPAEIQAEKSFFQGNRLLALEFYQDLTPAGGCLVSYVPTYRNTCQRIASIFDEMGDVTGRIEMERRLAFGAGVRDRTPMAHTYRQLATAYDQLGDVPAANAYDRTVLHCFDADRETRRSRDALQARDAAPGDPDDIILADALSSDPVLARAGQSALRRLTDPAGALERLAEEAALDDALPQRLDVLVLLPLDDLEARLHYLLVEGTSTQRRVAHDALKKRTGLSYPYLNREGEVEFEPPRSSIFHGRWGTPFLLHIMEDPYETESTRLMALQALGQIEDPRALEAILQATHEAAPAWRLRAVRALGAHDGDGVEKALVALASDPDPLVRLSAVAQIARRGLPDGADILAETLASESHPVIATAMVEALASMASEEDRVLDLLADLADEIDAPAMAKVGEVLRQYGDPRARRMLEAALDEPAPADSWASRALAAESLPAGETEIPTPLLDELSPATTVIEAPAMLSADSTPEEILHASLLGIAPPDRVVLRMLESNRWSEYRPAALALANNGSRAHLGALRGLARTSRYDADGSERVSYNEEALRILAWLQDDSSLPLFREVLSSHTYGNPRMAAAWALGRLQDHQSVPILVAAFVDPSNTYRVRRSAAQALSQFDDPELGSLVLGQLESADPRIRRLTILLLGDTGARHGVEQVNRVAEVDPDPGLRRLAAQMAVQLGGS